LVLTLTVTLPATLSFAQEKKSKPDNQVVPISNLHGGYHCNTAVQQ